MKESIKFHLPTKQMSLIDAINRCAAATGSVRYAILTSDADYNGHALRVAYNDYRGYYVCEYQWGERVVISRGDCETVLRDAIKEFGRQGRGASLFVNVLPEHADIARKAGLIEGDEPELSWHDWRFKEVAGALRLEQQLGKPFTTYLQDAADFAEYTRFCFPKQLAPSERSAGVNHPA